MAVTSALNYQFLRPCLPKPLTAEATLLRLGKRLAVMDVRLYTDDASRPVGQANVTYAIPLTVGASARSAGVLVRRLTKTLAAIEIGRASGWGRVWQEGRISGVDDT